MKTRRRFVMLMPWVPLAGVSLLAACSDKAPPPAASPAPAPMPAPAPAAPAETPAPAATSTAPTLVSPSDPQAQTLGYVPVSSQADATKYKTHDASQTCANCALYTGVAGEAAGPCPLFAGQLVAAEGWCSAWAKKA
ncbi:MAG: high-potential iron-sulfur protein [Rubrivivax sp.]|nr:high-potential iron-sulfur protein [Rubrivivax sp.]